MPEGTIKRLTNRGFGFINVGGDKDILVDVRVIGEFEDPEWVVEP